MSTEQAYNQFTNISYSGKKLLEKHNLSETGLWQVFGEDPNCDLHGEHHQPDLGIFEGSLKDVINLAIELPSFWTWGSGGNIVKVVIREVSPVANAEIVALKAELSDNESRAVAINARLKELGVAK